MRSVSVSSAASSRQAALAGLPSLNLTQAAEHLGAMVRCKTVWSGVEGPVPSAELAKLRAFIAATYPLVHQHMTVEQVGESLLYTWQPKTQSARKPIMLMSHLDVVPIEPGTEGNWKHPPFSGEVADGRIWGRGAIDTKGTLCAVLEATESLLAAGGEPTRPVYLAFGADEEVLGTTGAGAIAKLLESRGVKVEFLIDEGTPIVDGKLLGLPQRAGLVGTCEKGFVSVELTAKGPSGHSSIPHPNNAIEVMARVIDRLQTNPAPRRVTEPVRQTLRAIVTHLPFAKRMALQAGKLGEWLFMRELDKVATSSAMVRTISTPTIINGGVKDNVVPEAAKAVVNFRTLPGDTVDSVVAQVKTAIGDDKVSIGIIDNAHEASRVSSDQSAGFAALTAGVRAAFGDDVIMVPSLAIGATDARFYENVAEDAYRFSPYHLGAADVVTIHATNESLSIENLEGAIRFYQKVLTQAAVNLPG